MLGRTFRAWLLALGVTALASPSAATASSWQLPLEVVGGGGFVRGGVPFAKGKLPDAGTLRVRAARAGSPAITPATDTLDTWGDGSVRWVLVEFPAEAGTWILESSGNETEAEGDAELPPPPELPIPESGDLLLVIDGVRTDLGRATWTEERRTRWSGRVRATGRTPHGVRWTARIERCVGQPDDRIRLEILNPTPTAEKTGQPTCLDLDCEGTIHVQQVSVLAPGRRVRARWETENGAIEVPDGVALLPDPSQLRPGERFGWELVPGAGDLETPLLEYNAPWACRSGALGPLVPSGSGRWSEYELNNVAGAVGLRAGRCRPHWRNPREHGEDQRDWDGGVVDTDFQTHNNEYETLLTYAKQRLRTMGRHPTSRDWHYLGLTGARHFANVDIYHVHEGPLRWMHGAAFQHVKHGGSGRRSMHRSSFAPNMQHQTGRGLLAWYRLTGDPLLEKAFLEVAENTRWRVMNGPGMPGISNTTGEERAPAMALGILTDAWVHTGNREYLEAAKRVAHESHARTKAYVSDPDGTTWRCKPWMVTLLVVALDEFLDAVAEYGTPADGSEAKESAGLFKTFLRRVVVPDPTMTHLPYQFSNDPGNVVDSSRDSWSVVAADALCDFYPDVAERLLRSGSTTIWYPGHPVGTYAKLINHTVMSGWGHRTMVVLEREAAIAEEAAAAAAAAAGIEPEETAVEPERAGGSE